MFRQGNFDGVRFGVFWRFVPIIVLGIGISSCTKKTAGLPEPLQAKQQQHQLPQAVISPMGCGATVPGTGVQAGCGAPIPPPMPAGMIPANPIPGGAQMPGGLPQPPPPPPPPPASGELPPSADSQGTAPGFVPPPLPPTSAESGALQPPPVTLEGAGNQHIAPPNQPSSPDMPPQPPSPPVHPGTAGEVPQQESL